MAGTAQAGPQLPTNPAAREHLSRGNKLYNLRSFDEAVVEYKAGALIEPLPIFDYNLGQCFRNAGKYKEAIWHYERFLERGKPEGDLRENVERFLAQMKAELDHKAMTQQPTTPEPSGVSSSAPTPPDSRPASAAPQVASPRGERARSRWYDDHLAVTLAGVGLVGAAAGGALLMNANSIDNDGNQTQDEHRRAGLRDQADSRRLFGIAAGIGGLGLITVGVVRFALHRDSTTTALNIGVSANGMFAYGQF